MFKRKMILYILVFIFQSAVVIAQSEDSARPLQQISDASHLLSPKAQDTVKALLSEHLKLTGQEVLLVVEPTLQDSQEKPEDRVRRLFRQWNVGKVEKGSGALLAIDVKKERTYLEIGFALDSVLTEALSKDLLSRYFDRSLALGHLDRAAVGGIYRILEIVNSPLVESGKALEILKEDDFSQYIDPEEGTLSRGGWVFIFSLGVIAILFSLLILLAREAHFSAEGWQKHRFLSELSFRFKERKAKGNSHEELRGESDHW